MPTKFQTNDSWLYTSAPSRGHSNGSLLSGASGFWNCNCSLQALQPSIGLLQFPPINALQYQVLCQGHDTGGWEGIAKQDSDNLGQSHGNAIPC